MEIKDIENYFEANRERIMQDTISRIKDKIVEGFDYTIKLDIEKQIREQLTAVIGETVTTALQDQKQGIINGVKKATGHLP